MNWGKSKPRCSVFWPIKYKYMYSLQLKSMKSSEDLSFKCSCFGGLQSAVNGGVHNNSSWTPWTFPSSPILLLLFSVIKVQTQLSSSFFPINHYSIYSYFPTQDSTAATPSYTLSAAVKVSTEVPKCRSQHINLVSLPSLFCFLDEYSWSQHLNLVS